MNKAKHLVITVDLAYMMEYHALYKLFRQKEVYFGYTWVTYCQTIS